MRSSVSRPGSRGNEMRPRQPEAITESSGVWPSRAASCILMVSSRDFSPSCTAPFTRLPFVAARIVRPTTLSADPASVSVAPRYPDASLLPPSSTWMLSVAHAFLQRRAVALEEGGALRLTVVGEHHEMVRARGLLRRLLDTGELPIDLAQHRQRIRPLDARVVGDFIIGKKGRVGDRPACVEVADDRRHLEVALNHRSPRAHERVG